MVTPAMIVRSLSSGELHPYTSARPALIAFLANLLCEVVGSAEQNALCFAQKKLVDKLTTEATVDAAVALGQLSLSMRQSIACLVRGLVTDKMLEAQFRPGGVFQRSFGEHVLSLCEPPLTGVPLVLLPPYGALFNALLSADGTLLVSWRGGSWALDELVCDRLRWFFDHASELQVHHVATVKRISAAVLQSLASDGVGTLRAGMYHPPESMEDLNRVPAFAAILSLLSKQEAMSKMNGSSPMHAEFESALIAERAKRDGRARWYVSTAGFHVLLWLRILEAHVYLPKTSLTEAGLTAGIVSKAAAAGVKAWVNQGFFVTKVGVPSMVTSRSSRP